MQKRIQKLLVTVNQGIQFMWKGKDHMKVGRIDDFGSPFINPDFFKDRLAIRTVAIPTRIIVDLPMSAIGTQANVTAEFTGFTV